MKERKEAERRMGLREAAQITGVPIPTLSYWIATGVIRPKEARGEGRGRRYAFSLLNLIEILTVARLRKRGLPMQRLRRAVEVLERRVDVSRPLAMLTLVTDGQDLFEVVEGEGELARMVRCHDGQGVFAIALDEVYREVKKGMDEAAVHRVRVV